MIVDIHPAAVLGNEVGELAVDDLGDLDLLIGGVAGQGDTGIFDHLTGSLHHLQTGSTAAEVHEVDDGLPDDIVQGHQNGQRQKAPQAPAHGVDALFLVELLHLLIHFYAVIGVLFLDLLHFPGHPIHADHALLRLHLEGQQDQLDDQGEQDQRYAVRAGQIVKQADQPCERCTDPVNDG